MPQKHKKQNRIIGILSLIVSLAVMGVIFWFSAQPGSDSDSVSISLTSLLFTADKGLLLNSLVRKFAHLLEYMALGAPLYVFFRTLHRGDFHARVAASTLSALYAVGDEIHQLFVPGRACCVSDMVLDTVGAALCITLLHCIIKSGKKKPDTLDDELAGQRFLAVCSCHLTGKPLDFDVLSEKELQDLIRIAAGQKLLPVVYSTLKKQGKLDASQPTVIDMRKRSLAQIASQAVKTEAFLDIYTKMLDAGAKPLCLKGVICRAFYRHPDQRPSADEDLLVTEKDWPTCVRVLTDSGFILKSEAYGEQTFTHPENGCRIELHSAPFKSNHTLSKQYNAILGDLYAHAESVECSGRTVYCPCGDDHLLYLYLHAFLHFINAGVGIRQIMDITVLSQNYNIDYVRLRARMREVGVSRFAANVMVIEGTYFGFDLGLVKETDELFDERTALDPLLEDILSGGIFGGSLERKHASTVTSNEDMSFFKALFPGRDRLKARYPSLQKHGWLLPAVWVKRAILFLFEEHSIETVEEAKRRSELIKTFVEK